MAKNIVDKEAVESLLRSSKKGDVKKAVKQIVQGELDGFSEKLKSILDETISDEKLWEMNCQIINYLGVNRFRESLPLLIEICDKNEPRDMVTAASARAICRIERKSNEDVQKVLQLLSFGNFAVINGALKSMGQDKIIPHDEEANRIIDIISKFEPKQEKGYADIRVGLALACAGWEKTNIIQNFLDECLLSGYNPLVKIAANAKKGKYTDID